MSPVAEEAAAREAGCPAAEAARSAAAQSTCRSRRRLERLCGSSSSGSGGGERAVPNQHSDKQHLASGEANQVSRLLAGWPRLPLSLRQTTLDASRQSA